MSLPTQFGTDLFGSRAPIDWRSRLEDVVATMRAMSVQTDPQEMVRIYGTWVRNMTDIDRFVSISRRGLEFPQYRITRSSLWKDAGLAINPWTEKEKLPVYEGGVLGELLYGDVPRIIDDLQVDDDDPAFEHLEGQRSLMAIPNYDQGVGMNMTVRLSTDMGAFDPETFPEHVWLGNLFGRATQNLVLSAELKQAYEVVDRELRLVADIQRSLLPKVMPTIPTLDLAAHYQTSQWAGGDYYDFFELPDGRWGILIADVSGHGTPAAVIMAITHSVAHGYSGPSHPPGDLLAHVNDELSIRYTAESEAFVTAFYGVYDPKNRELTYACAGHNPPRLKRCEDGSIASLDGVSNLPLGLFPGLKYENSTRVLIPGDQIIFYTDGVTEATDAQGQMFGMDRLDLVLENCHLTADGLIREVLNALEDFTGGAPVADDRTLLVAKIS